MRKDAQWQRIHRTPIGWPQELNMATACANGKNAKAGIYRMVIAGTVYYLWQERNLRHFQGKLRRSKLLSRLIVQHIHCRGNCNKKIARQLRKTNFYP